MKEDFIETYVRNTLNEIKNCIKTKINLEREQEEKTDEKLSSVLKELIDGNFKNINVDGYGNLIHTLLPLTDEKENNKIRCSLVLYYTALYFDNVKLLNRMLKEEVNFGNRPNDLDLYVLDRDISSKFEEDEYIEVVKDCIVAFNGFYKTTKDLPKEEREKYITRFVSVLKARHKDLTPDGISHRYYWLFDKKRMDMYEDDSYLKASKKQLNIIANSNTRHIKNEDTIRRLNNLIQTTDFNQHYWNTDLMFSLFSDDELFNINYWVAGYFDTFSDNRDMLNKAMDFYNRTKDINADGICVHCSRDAFMMVDNDVLVEIFNKRGFIPDEDELKAMAVLVKPKVKLKRIFKRK